MISWVKSKDIDVKKWDECVRLDASKYFYGYSWYLDILINDWDALVLDDYQAVFPLVSNKKYFVNYLFRPYGVQQLGVFSRLPQTPEMIRDFIEAIPAKYKFVDVYLNANNPTGLLNKKQLRPNRNLELNLNRTYQKIYEGYNKRTLRNLSKAKKHNHRVFENDSPDQLINLFKDNRGKKVDTLSEDNYSTIRQIMYVMLHKHRGYIWTIYDEHNTIITGAFFVEMNGRIILLFSATNDIGKKERAMTYLLDELFIARAGDQIIFDFEGSNIKGMAEFYSGFGAQEKIYYNLLINKLPGPFKYVKRVN